MGRKPTFDEYDPWVTYNPDGPNLIRRKPRQSKVANGLHDVSGAAAILNVTEDQLLGFVHDGLIRYVNVGRGSKKPRYRFTDPDLQEFIENRKQQEIPQCQFSKQRSQRRITGSTSKPVVVGFMALRNAQLAKRPRNPK